MRFSLAQFKDAALVPARTEVHAHPDLPPVDVISVPGIVVPAVRQHAIEATAEPGCLSTPSNRPHGSEKLRAVGQEVKQTERDLIFTSQLCTDALVYSFAPGAIFKPA